MTEASEAGTARRTVALVTTTINVPTVLDGYVAQLRDRADSAVLIIVVGDRRTPEEIRPWLEHLDDGDRRVSYLGVAEQKAWLRRFPALDALLPWDSIQRRNIGYLYAAEQGADIVISVDDDNQATDDDFVGSHRIVGTVSTVDSLTSSTGWFNACDLLRTRPPARVTARGFPASQRHALPTLTRTRSQVRVMVNAGLWLGDPDVDAVCRLLAPVEAVDVVGDGWAPVALAPATYSPFNSQNTAFDIRLLPCMYLVVMGGRYRGMRVGRYDDVWMSYFAKRIMDHLGDTVTFGPPLVRQVRNHHDILEDLAEEVPGMILTEYVVRALPEVRLHETTYLGAYRELTAELREVFARPAFCGTEERSYLTGVLDGMDVWAQACAEVRP